MSSQTIFHSDAFHIEVNIFSSWPEDKFTVLPTEDLSDSSIHIEVISPNEWFPKVDEREEEEVTSEWRAERRYWEEWPKPVDEPILRA